MLKSQMEKKMVEDLVSKGFAYMFNNQKSETFIEKSNDLTKMGQHLTKAKETIDQYAKIQSDRA